MIFLHSESQSKCARVLASKLGEWLEQDRKVLWLLSGGSNIAISVEAFNILKKEYPARIMPNLAVTLTDERFGKVGHHDSNWQHLLDAGFVMSEIWSVPVLNNIPLDKTVEKFTENYKELSHWADVVIGQFGIGPDGHIAGILPGSVAVTSKENVCGYDGGKFIRVTLTLHAIRSIDIAYSFAFGSSKKEAIQKLHKDDVSVSDEPAEILKKIPESYLFSDQV